MKINKKKNGKKLGSKLRKAELERVSGGVTIRRKRVTKRKVTKRRATRIL